MIRSIQQFRQGSITSCTADINSVVTMTPVFVLQSLPGVVDDCCLCVSNKTGRNDDVQH